MPLYSKTYIMNTISMNNDIIFQSLLFLKNDKIINILLINKKIGNINTKYLWKILLERYHNNFTIYRKKLLTYYDTYKYYSINNSDIIPLSGPSTFKMSNYVLFFKMGYYKKGQKCIIEYDKYISTSYVTESIYNLGKQSVNDFNFSNNVKTIIEKFNLKYNIWPYVYRDKAYYIQWTADKYIVYWDHGTSMIISNDDIFDIVNDEESHYQSGDGKSLLYIFENGDYLIANSGDIESCILFTMHNPKVTHYQVEKNKYK